MRLLTFHNMLVRAIHCVPDVGRLPPDAVSTFNRWFVDLTGTTLGGLDNLPSAQEIVGRLRVGRAARSRLKEILIDEGQDLPASAYEALPQAFEDTRLFVTADDAQQVHTDHGARKEELQIRVGRG